MNQSGFGKHFNHVIRLPRRIFVIVIVLARLRMTSLPASASHCSHLAGSYGTEPQLDGLNSSAR